MSFNKPLLKTRFSFTKSRSVVVVNILLAFLIGFPNTASAADLDIGSNVSLVLPGSRFTPGNSGVFFSGTTLEAINTSDPNAASALTSYGVPLTTQPFVMTTAIQGAMPGGSTTWDHFNFTVGATYKFFALVNPTTDYAVLSYSSNYGAANLDYMTTWSEAKLNIGGTEHWVIFGWFNLILVEVAPAEITGNTPTYVQHSSNESGYTIQITNYDPTFTYSITTSAGSVSIDSAGLITVSGLRPDQTATVTVTTSRSGYSTISTTVSGRAGVLPMLPTNKPTVTISDNLITCTIGSYSAAPTSAAFSLFVDGKHISTNFSALGELLPDWIIPWATSSTITRTATLTSASWAISEAYKGKAITCSTLAYSKNAIGLTASAPMTAR
jgi:hypothetical protein